jgi:hypothetical protein
MRLRPELGSHLMVLSVNSQDLLVRLLAGASFREATEFERLPNTTRGHGSLIHLIHLPSPRSLSPVTPL